ncbi:hypothetical protein C0995_001891 [Termitomyces sp. Mi166|nr:hypothetical protein C0995_001891 [Termitomyces sp. Mi166\
MDTGFPFAAFSQAQVKAATSGGFLAAERTNFKDVADRLVSINQDVFTKLAKRMADGELVKPVTEDEKACFRIIDDLDAISGHVVGSAVSKKHMRNEIWSIVVNKADIKHPICLYFAD